MLSRLRFLLILSRLLRRYEVIFFCFYINSPWHADIIKNRYSIPKGLPTPKLPNFSLSTITKVLPTSISIAVLAAIESLLSAVVADGMIGAKHNSNNELIGQGIANIFSPLFGGLPATGAIARTAKPAV